MLALSLYETLMQTNECLRLLEREREGGGGGGGEREREFVHMDI